MCTPGWENRDCSIAIEREYSNSSYLNKSAICVAFGDPHVTTFSRANYHIGITGPFEAFKSQSSVLKVLQVPCKNSAKCRRVREISLTSQSSTISVSISAVGKVFTNLSSNVLSGSTLSYSTSWHVVGEEKYRWLDGSRLEIVDRDETKLTVLAYYGTLAVAVETSRRLKSTGKGICGSSDGDWKRDILEVDNTTALNGAVPVSPLANLTQAKHDYYINNLMRVKDTRMITAHALSYRTGGGYMLSLGANYLSLILDFTYLAFSEVSIELWVKLSMYSKEISVGRVLKGKRVLYSIVQEGSNFTVRYNNGLVINWGSYEITTGFRMKNSIWTHLSVTWRNRDGRLAVMLAEINGYRNKSTHYGILINNFFYVDRGFFFGHEENENSNIEITLEFDELRVWQFSRKDEDIVKTMAVKLLSYIDGLVIFCGFDEGYGETTSGTLYALRDNATTSGYYYRGNKTQDQKISFQVKPQGLTSVWKPSGAPYPNLGDYQTNFESDALKINAKTECRKLFYSGNLHKYCGKKLVTQTLFYYEACLLDVVHSGDIKHTKISVSMFAFYCQKVLGIPVCNLHGFYDGFPACEEDTGLDVRMIVSISVGAFIFIILIAICIIFLCRRRNKESLDNREHSRGIHPKRVPLSDMNKDVGDDDLPPRYNYGLAADSAEPDAGKRMEESSF